jgi:dihydrofolate reductase
MGRVSYERWFEAWPQLRASESRFDARFSQFADDVDKVVVSNTLTASEWNNSRVIAGDIRSEITELKRQPGKDIAIVGGATIAQAIGNLGLIDEYRLWLRPVILGRGASLFDRPLNVVDLTLIEAKTFDSGLVALHYARA